MHQNTFQVAPIFGGCSNPLSGKVSVWKDPQGISTFGTVLDHGFLSIACLYNRLIAAKKAVGERLLMYLLAYLTLLPSISPVLRAMGNRSMEAFLSLLPVRI